MTQAKNPGFPQFFADTKSAESVRRHLLEAPLDAVGPSLLAAGVELGQLLSILPGALIESQKRELNRLKTTGAENDERVALLESSIADVEGLQTVMRAGQARAQRVVGAATTGEDVFHGFVTDADLAPVAGVTVRLRNVQVERSKPSATTDENGYFSIPLGTKRDTAAGGASSLTFSQRLNRMFEAPSVQPKPAPTPAPQGEKQDAKENRFTARVEIVRKRQVIHEDPNLVLLDAGTVYREYVVSEEPSTAKDIDEFVSKLGVNQKTGTGKKAR